MPSNIKYASIAELPQQLRLFPLTGATLLPGSYLPLNIFEPRYLAMVDEALKDDRLIGMIQPKLDKEETHKSDLETVGCAGRIIQLAETGDGRYRITLYGVARFSCLEALLTPTPFRCHRVDFSPFVHDLTSSDTELAIDREKLLHIIDLFSEITNVQFEKNDIDTISTSMLINSLATIGNFSPVEKQALLETHDAESRAELLYSLAQFMLAKKNSGKDMLQ